MKHHPVDETLTLIRETCLRFAREKIEPFAYEWEEAELFPRALYNQAAEAGILGAGVPEVLGMAALRVSYYRHLVVFSFTLIVFAISA